MAVLDFFRTHKHYWGVPHKRRADGKLVQTCYACSKERQVAVNFSSDGNEVARERDTVALLYSELYSEESAA